MSVQRTTIKPGRKLTSAEVAARYGGRSVRTIDRWIENGELPPPMRINRFRFWDEKELDAFDARRLRSRAIPSSA